MVSIMTGTTIITRGNRITLAKDIREKLKIKEGDRLILNLEGDMLIVTKRNSKALDDLKGFLPTNFETDIRGMRTDEIKRLKRLGII